MSGLAPLLDMPTPVGLEDLGGAWDTALYRECRRFARLDEEAKRAVRGEMNRDRSWAIVGWAEGMASLGVREKDRDRLVYGLVGLSLFCWQDFDQRDAAVI